MNYKIFCFQSCFKGLFYYYHIYGVSETTYCCLVLRLPLVPVLSFKNSNAPLLSVEFRDLFLRNSQLCYSCRWEPRIPYQGDNIFKRKRQKSNNKKLQLYQKMRLLCLFNFSLLVQKIKNKKFWFIAK